MRGSAAATSPVSVKTSEVEASWDPGQDNSLVSRDDYMIMQGAQCMCVHMGNWGWGGHQPGLG